MAFVGYFDDSNSHDGAPLILWAGFVGYSNQFDFLDERWRAILKREKLTHFSMKDCEEGSPPFDRRDPSRAWRDSVIHDLREVIFKSGVFGIAAGVQKADWASLVTPEMEQWLSAPGTVCLILCSASSIERAEQRGCGKTPMSLFFDQGIVPEGIQSAVEIGEIINGFKERKDTYGFLPVKAVPALQAADMFAWELQSDMKNYLRLGRDRPIRPHYARWLSQQKDVQFLERDQIAARLAMPEFQKALDDRLWNIPAGNEPE